MGRNMIELQVGLGDRGYPIFIQAGCLADIGEDLARRTLAKRFGIIADDQVAGLYGRCLLESLEKAGIRADLFTFRHGEARKTLQTIGELASGLARAGFDRKDGLIALGGGVTGDITGFLASSYMRGIPFIQIPTSLLAQVDSSVGGKTGVDIPEGKNLVGTFYQPKVVHIDIDFLATLPRQEFLGGLAEVIKYGVIRDAGFFSFLEQKKEDILTLEPDILTQMIATCCKIKAEIVALDEKEGGLRKILNYGHTIGHAVEAASSFTIIHGFAVAIGMVAAAKLATLKRLLTPAERDRIIALIADYGLPISVPPELDRATIENYLKTDKKAEGGRVYYVLPVAIGKTILTDEISANQLADVLL